LDERNKSATSVLDMLSVVRGTASGVFSSDGWVFVFSKFARCNRVEARIFSSLASEPIEGSPIVNKGG
jgi:hypothetical protein